MRRELSLPGFIAKILSPKVRHEREARASRYAAMRRWVLHAVVVVVAMAATFGVAQAAYLPSVKIGTAPLLTPSAADSFYGPTTTSTNGLGSSVRPPEIVELARALKNDPDLIYKYVRNNIDVVWLYGLQKGALGAAIDKSGTPFDQAMLMVELLRQAGIPASYQAGTASFTPQQFADWTGISDATAACQLLSSGGIPAVINGTTSSTCAYGTGTAITSIQIAHIWVAALINGTTYLFDPSYKPYNWKAGLNISSVMGLTAGTPYAQATSGMDSGTASGADYVHNLNASALNTKLSTYASNLLTYLQTPANGMVGATMNDVVGGGVIVPDNSAPGTLRQTSIPGYVMAHSWTSSVVGHGIPDQYRTKLTVEGKMLNASTSVYDVMFNRLLYADEIYGRRLTVDTDFNFDDVTTQTDYRTNTVSLKLDDAVLDTYTDPAPGSQSNATSRGYPATIYLSVDHPYAANSGAYMDELGANSIVKQVVLVTALEIVEGWGETSSALFTKWADERTQDTQLPKRFNPPICADNEPCLTRNNANPRAGDFQREKTAASYLAQFTAEANLNAHLAHAISQVHHVLGVVYSDPLLKAAYGTPTEPPDFVLADSFDRLDIDSGVSLTSTTGDANARRAGLRAIAATGAALEGSMAGQMADLPDTSSTATRFGWGNNPPSAEDVPSSEGTSVGQRKFFEFTSSNASAASSVVTVDGRTSWSGDGTSNANPPSPPEINAGEAGAWAGALTDDISDYASAGYTVVASQEAFLGPGQRGGAYEVSGTTYTHQESKQRGGAFVATRYASGEPVEIAHITDGTSILLNGATYVTKGGGGGVQPDQDITYNPSDAADILKSHFVDRSNVEGVNLSNGSMSYTSPASLKTGSGDFPYALTVGFNWKAGNTIKSRLPGPGWSTSWDNGLALSGSGMEAMGQSDIRAAVGAIAAFAAAQDIYNTTPASGQEAAPDVAALLAENWWVGQLMGNVATVAVGSSSRQFIKTATGSWVSPGAGPYTSFMQSGTRSPVAVDYQTCQNVVNPYPLTRGWDNSGLSFAVTNANGDVENFGYYSSMYALSSAGDICGKHEGFHLNTWVFPQGSPTHPTITLTYPGSGDTFLLKVANNFARTLTYTGTSGSNLTISDGTNSISQAGFESAAGVASDTDGAGAVTSYTYILPPTNPVGTPTTRPIPYALLQQVNQVYAVGGTSKPTVKYDYDSEGRVMQVEDAVRLQLGGRNPYNFYIADGTRGERDDPLGQPYTVTWDTDHLHAMFSDELSLITDAIYDGRGRVLSYTYPEGDCEAFAYDTHNNTTDYWKVDTASDCNTAATDMTHVLHVSATWDQTWNKPLTISNAKHKVTTLTYYAASTAGASLLHTATRPAIGSGTPVYSFTYDAKGKVQTSVVPLTSSQNVTTTNAYDATTENLLSTTVDAGGVASVTGFGYDAVGNITSTTDPRGYVTTSIFDGARRKTEDDHHNGNATAALNAASKTIYDPLGRDIEDVAGTVFSGTTVTTWLATKLTAYTPSSKVASVTDADDSATATAYDNADRVSTITDPVSRKVHFVYCAPGDANCAANQVKTEYRGWSSGTACSVSGTDQQCYRRVAYFPDGEQQSVTDANGNVTTYGYDGFARLTQTTFPDTSNEILTLDADGDVLTRKNRAGQTLTYTYNDLDWVSTKASPSPAVTTTWTYMLNGAIDQISDTASNIVNYGYDTAGRLTSEADTIPSLSGTKTTTYTLDDSGNRTGLTWPDSYAVTYTYDSLNRMATASDSTGTLATYTYDPLSRRTNLLYGNGASMAYTYSDAGDLLTLNHDMSGTANDPHYTFTYTAAHQLRTEANSDADFVWSPGANGSSAYTHNNLNQYATVGGNTFSYDGNGNLTSDSAVTLAYDAENRLLTASKTGVAATYAYDPLGRRTHKSGTGVTETYFVDSGTDEIAEYNSAGALTNRYVPGPAIDEPVAMVTSGGTKSYFHTNHQGSVIAMSGASAALVEGPYTYDPYGNCFSGGSACSSSGEPYRFTGRRRDPEIASYYYRARFYSSGIGRFFQTDPVGYIADLNLYTYVGNDPTDKTDPTGMVAGVDDAAEAVILLTVATGAVIYCEAAGCMKPLADWAGLKYNDIVHRNDTAKPQAPGSRPGKPFTQKGKQAVKEGNKEAHGGKQTCEGCGTETTPAQQGQKGVAPPGTQTEVDHVDPKSNGGSGTPENGQVLCRDCNQAKGSSTPQQQPSQPQQSNMQSSSACDKNGICGVP